MAQIKALLLDFGGVLYDIMPEKTVRAFAALARPNSEFTRLKSYDFTTIPFLRLYEKGEISTDEFRANVVNLLGLTAPDATETDAAWNAILLEPKANIDRVIDELADDYPIYLLSNTNEIHHRHFAPECEVFFRAFRKCYFSYLLKMIKPDREIFEFVAGEIGLKPEEILFADDSLANIETAKSLGFVTFHIGEDGKTIYNLSDFLHTV